MTELFTSITRITVLVFLVSSMSGIGLGLTLREIVAPLRNVRIVVFTMIANFILSPLLAIGISRLLRLDEPFTLGLLLLGLAAGAPFLPKVVGMAKGDLALSVGLMVLMMIGTTLCLPIMLPLLIKGVQVNPWKIARFLILLMLLPLAAGLVIKAHAASMAVRLRPVLEKISTIALLVVLILIITLNFEGFLRIFGTGAILAAVIFSMLSALSGWLLGGRQSAQRTVLGLGTGLRNVPAALIVGVQNFKDPDVTVMILVTTLTGIAILLPFARWMGKHHTDRTASTATHPVNPPNQP